VPSILIPPSRRPGTGTLCQPRGKLGIVDTLQRRLKWEAVMWTHEAEIKETRYKVSDERGEKVAFTTDTRASCRPPCWQISRVRDGGSIRESAGDYATAKAALSALQKEFGQDH
jgi:hypothetical protein